MNAPLLGEAIRAFLPIRLKRRLGQIVLSFTPGAPVFNLYLSFLTIEDL